MPTTRLVLAVFAALAGADAARACPHCRVEARAAVRADRPAETALVVLAPLLVIVGVGRVLYTSGRDDA